MDIERVRGLIVHYKKGYLSAEELVEKIETLIDKESEISSRKE